MSFGISLTSGAFGSSWGLGIGCWYVCLVCLVDIYIYIYLLVMFGWKA